MGVTYKITQEVQDFIIEQKTDNPSLSCRILTDLTNTKFGINVSKSSVNSVLKQALLSSSVGRRPVKKTFKIPSDKKKQISASLHQVRQGPLPSSNPSKKSNIEDELARLTGVPTLSSLKESSSSNLLDSNLLSQNDSDKHNVPVDEKDQKILSHEDKAFRNRVSELKQRQEESMGLLYEGMGLIFLKAAQWITSGKSLVSEALIQSEECPNTGIFESACDVLFYLKLLGMNNLGKINDFSHHGVWPLHGLSSEANSQAVAEIVRKLKINNTVKSIYHNGLEQSKTLVGRLDLVLEDKTRLVIDPQIVARWDQEVNGRYYDYFYKVIQNVTEEFISNKRIPQFYTWPMTSETQNSMNTLVAAMSDTAQCGIDAIEVFTPTGDLLARYPVIRSKTRYFCTGLWPNQKGFDALIQSTDRASAQPYYHAWADKVFYYSCREEKLPGEANGQKQDVCKIISLWNLDSCVPICVLVTNDLCQSAEDIVFNYILRWNSLEKFSKMAADWRNRVGGGNRFQGSGGESLLGMDRLQEIIQAGTIWDLFDDYAQVLHRQTNQAFFPKQWSENDISHFITNVYGLSGRMVVKERHIWVNLVIPKEYPFERDIIFAARKVNERQVLDEEGRLLSIRIRG